MNLFMGRYGGDMKQVMMSKAKARAFGRVCQCVGCGSTHKHKCGQDIECIGRVGNEVLYLCHACGEKLEKQGHKIAEIVF
jgi:hypothetical protein